MCTRSLWIVNHYAQSPDLPGGTRHYDLARRLRDRGWDVTIVASGFNHWQRTHVAGGRREGVAIHGVLRDILQQNLRQLNPDGFQRACLAAAAVYEELANELPSDSEEAARYHNESEYYRRECGAQSSQKEDE